MKKPILKALPADSHRRLQYRSIQALLVAAATVLPPGLGAAEPGDPAVAINAPLAGAINTPVMETTTVKTITATNLMHPQDSVFTSGQPTQEEFQAMAEAGIKHIINLRPNAEMDWDEAQYVESLGMTYSQLPIASAADLTVSNAEALDQLLNKAGGEPVLVHCASGNRIGAVIAVREAKIRQKELEEAISTGKQWGLTKLEPQVRDLLSRH